MVLGKIMAAKKGRKAQLDAVIKRIREAQKDPAFRARVEEFIAATTHSK